jgi:hypothetical protein
MFLIEEHAPRTILMNQHFLYFFVEGRLRLGLGLDHIANLEVIFDWSARSSRSPTRKRGTTQKKQRNLQHLHIPLKPCLQSVTVEM